MASTARALSPFRHSLPFDPGWLIASGVSLLGLASAVVLWEMIGDWRFGIGFLIGFGVVMAVALVAGRAQAGPRGRSAQADRALVRAALDAAAEPAAITDREGRLVSANRLYLDRFGPSAIPPDLPGLSPDNEAVAVLGREAWRDGAAEAEFGTDRARLGAQRVGLGEEYLLWRVADPRGGLRDEAARLVGGQYGERLGAVGVMAALVDERGRILVANRVFAARATGGVGTSQGRDFAAQFVQDEAGRLRFARDEEARDPVRLLHVPVEGDEPAEGAATMLLFDDPVDPDAAGPATQPSDVYDLLQMLPLGLALVDRDGRFLFLNRAFARAAAMTDEDRPVYPGDLVVKEDKAAVADAVRRFAGLRPPTGLTGQTPILSGDIAVRLARRPDEAVSLTVGSARGLGTSAVLLSLKDSGEENRLKRQVTQANKMQAVGQLAGGIAHDFNNILTALIGHCDLMLMRHTPGDSDYDDIHQIRTNANRAANLTRQLLAFSRQQTLRPQTLQLPDVVSEVSNLLKRLLGDQTKLEINHGRALGPVRADPGQLEQVIVNLCVNARDAMPGGGTITIRTYGVAAAEVRRLGSDILPVGDYTALSVTDTGTGIAPSDLPKIFEPFFTTKEVGKGTGLGLSTVYGIVKQSGGFIFADSELGRGTSFVIYLPVFHGERPAEIAPEKAAPAPALWGSGSILVVEDEDMVRSVAERALARQGYQVRTASNGDEGLELLDQVTAEGGGFDLLISDVMMPVMDGPTMAGHVRERFPGMPVLFMSGYAEEQLRKSISLENISFLPKPFTVQQLAEAARDVLARAAGREEGR